MKKFTRIGALCAAVAALALGAVAPAGAGIAEHGTVLITPDPAEVGTTVVIGNADDEDSLCEDEDGEDVVAEVWVYSLESDAFDQYFEVLVDNDTGLWSLEFTIPNDDAAIGEWEVDATCDWPSEGQPLAFPPFLYNLAQFEVVGAQQPITPPDDGAAPAEEVRAAPRFTG